MPAGPAPRRAHHVHRLIGARRRIGALAALFLLVAAAVAIAKPTGTIGVETPAEFDGLAKVGPIDPDFGFPTWYRDTKGVALEPCIDPNDANCLPPAGFDPSKPLTLTSKDPAQNNFPDEFFYQNVDSKFQGIGDDPNARVEIMNNLEGAFAAGPVIAGDQMVFSRFRARIDGGLKADTNYLIAHPYGTDEITTDATGGQGGATNTIFATKDVGAVAGGFSATLNTRADTFLKWDPAVAPAAPKGYLGDPAVAHPLVGSPVDTNYVAIIGPNVGAGAPFANRCPEYSADTANVSASHDPNTPSNRFKDQIQAIVAAAPSDSPESDPSNDCVWNPLFNIAGKLATRSGVEITRATYSRDKGAMPRVQVLAESNAGQTITLQDADPAARSTADRAFDATLFKGALGQYYAQATIRHMPTGTTNPPKVEVVNQSDVPATVKDVQPVDAITGTATYDGTTLTVVARSSDQDADGQGTPAQLSVPTDSDRAAPVDSFKSRFSKSMDLVGSGDETASFAIDAPPGHVDVTSAQGGTTQIPVTLSVSDTAPAPLTANAGADQSIFDGPTEPASITLTGSASTGNIDGYRWDGPYAVDAAGNLTGNPDSALGAAPVASPSRASDATVRPPTTAGSYGYRLTVTGDGGSDSDDMVLTVGGGPVAMSDTITPGTARYTESSDRFTVNGTDSVPTNNAVTVHNGCSVNGPVIGTSQVATDNTWSVDVRGTGIKPMACVDNDIHPGAWVTMVSKLGAVVQQQVDVRPIDKANPPAPLPPAPLPPAPPLANPAPAAAAAAVPLLGTATAAPFVGLARVAIAPAVSATALAAAGVPVTVTVPARATVLRVRVLATAKKALLSTFQKVRATKKARKLKIRLRSRKLRSEVRSGHRYVLEVTPGTSRTRLGKATRTSFRVR
jgi:hypothetical protein